MKILIALLMLATPLSAQEINLQENVPENSNNYKVWGELGIGSIADELGVGLKAKMRGDNYTYALEFAISDAEGIFNGKESRTGEDIDDLMQFNFLIGTETYFSIFEISADIGAGVLIGQEYTNCESNPPSDLGFGSFFGGNDVCDLEDVTAFQVPMSLTFSTGSKYLGIGIGLSYTLSSYDNYAGFRLVIPFGQYK